MNNFTCIDSWKLISRDYVYGHYYRSLFSIGAYNTYQDLVSGDIILSNGGKYYKTNLRKDVEISQNIIDYML